MLCSRYTFAASLALLLVACAAERPPAQSGESPAAAEGTFTPADASGFGRAGELIYLEEVVGDAQPSDPLPMVVLIHGRGDKPERGWLPLAPPVAVRVIMPQAPLAHGDGFSWSGVRAIEASGPNGDGLARDLEKHADQIATAIEILRAHRPTRGVPIAAGFSQGGMLSFTLAVRHPHAFSALMPISGLLPEALWPSEPPSAPLPPILALHGTADTLVPIAPARAAIAHLAEKGYRAELREQEGVGHSITPAMLEALNGWLSESLAR